MYPIFAGFAINSLIAGERVKALVYALVVLFMWFVGAVRQRIDTQVFTSIYAKIAVNVILNEKQNQKDDSAIIARVALSREFVNFFESHFPMFFTTVVSIIGSAFMLLFIELKVAFACVLVMVVFALVLPRYVRRNDYLYLRLNDRLEKEAAAINLGKFSTLKRHYDIVSRLRVAISNREAMSYFIIGVSAAFLTIDIGGKDSAGHIYSVVTYLCSFAISLDDSPRLIEEFSNLKDIGKRINAANKE
ncbi:ABC transporter, ATP-binding/permease components [Campylobacter curvus]|nr:ABC transporter, ATP-binding/permease components [Campylobacter curvus]